MSDIVFSDKPNEVTVIGDNLKIQGHDFLLDSVTRRKPHQETGFRRALVHDQNDGLTINFNGDYSGGVTIHGVTLLDVVGEIQMRTGILVDTAMRHPHSGTRTEKLSEVIASLRQEIADLKAQVAKLSARG